MSTAENTHAAPNWSSLRSSERIEIDHNHPLYLFPTDTPGSSLVSVKLIGSENYALWSRSMTIGLLGKSKLGLVDGRHTKEKFDSSLHEQWEKVNAVVLSWIMNSVEKDLLSSIIYASNAHKVWLDLKERFDTVNGSRIFFLHREITTLSQGTMSVAEYFSKLRNLWDEFDALMPCPGCSCTESRSYAKHHGYQRLLQFLMGLNETYVQCRSQILMMSPTPTLNKAYSMVIDHESQRSITNVASMVSDTLEGAVFFSQKGGTNSGYKGKGLSISSQTSGKVSGSMSNGHSGGWSSNANNNNRPVSINNYRPQKKQVVCEHCGYNGHTKDNCYKIIGYPLDWPRNRKKGGVQYANLAEECNADCSSSLQTTTQLPPYFTQEQYQQIIQLLNKGSEEENHPPSSANAGSLHWLGERDW